MSVSASAPTTADHHHAPHLRNFRAFKIIAKKAKKKKIKKIKKRNQNLQNKIKLTQIRRAKPRHRPRAVDMSITQSTSLSLSGANFIWLPPIADRVHPFACLGTCLAVLSYVHAKPRLSLDALCLTRRKDRTCTSAMGSQWACCTMDPGMRGSAAVRRTLCLFTWET